MDKYVGKLFGYYKILEKTDLKHKDGHSVYKAECIDCGRIIYGKVSDIVDCVGEHCKHIRKCVKSENHFLSTNSYWENNGIKAIFSNIILRCYNENYKDYRFYGAKGIKLCSEWLNNPKSFEDWALLNGYQDNFTIDRINSSKDYSPDNCRWVTAINNSKWKSTTNIIIVNDIKDSGRGWSKRLGLGVNFINTYLRNNGIDKTIDYIKSLLY